MTLGYRSMIWQIHRTKIPPYFAKDTLCELYAFREFRARGVSCIFKHDPFEAVEREKKHELPKDSKETFKRYKVQSKKLKSYRKTAQSKLSGPPKKRRLAVVAKGADQGEKFTEGHGEENSSADLGCLENRTQNAVE